AATVDECLDVWKKALPRRDAGGALIARPWDLVQHNAAQIAADFRQRRRAAVRPLDLTLVGPAGQLAIGPTARLAPLVVADTTNGPVIIDRDAYVGAFSRLEGPCYIGPGTHVL